MSNSSADESRERLKGLLRELFQFDVADLDFGIYRIMNQRREEIEKFIEWDLIAKTEEAFKGYTGSSSETLATELEKLRKEINVDFGSGTIDEHGEAVKHDDAPKIQEYLRKREEMRKCELTQGQVDDVYNQVYEFFNRYFDKGDFLSRRRYGGKNKYVIPYNGEEVVLHWANRDQYYVKTAENFTNYEFKADGWKVKFVLVHAEADQNNLQGQERFFTLAERVEPLIELNERVLTISFQYRELTKEEDKNLAKRNKQDQLSEKALEEILKAAKGTPVEPVLVKSAQMNEGTSKRIIEKHLHRFVKKNTSDYFIHKELKGFLTRELDFFVKNEVLLVDELVSMSEAAAKQNMARVKAIRGICTPIIEFLAQVERFQRMLFEKRKFVLRAEYCMTLDRVPRELYSEIATNGGQVAEWKRLFRLNEICDITDTPSTITETLNVDYLTNHPFLVLDTAFFDQEFKDRLLGSYDNLDEQIGGLLIKSENWHALKLLEEKYHESIRAIYIDPPYNTDASAILYKNDYKDSSWLTLMENRLQLAVSLLERTGIICVAIDDEEVSGLRFVLSQLFEKEIGIVAVRSNPAGRKTKGRLAPAHEYALFFGKSADSIPASLERSEKTLSRFPKRDEEGRFAWANFIRSGRNDKRADRPKLFYPIFVSSDDRIRIPKMRWDEKARQYELLEQPGEDEVEVYPIAERDGVVVEKNWQRGHERVPEELEEYRVRRSDDGKINIDFKTRMDEESLPTTWWENNKYASANYGPSEMKKLFGDNSFDFPKSRRLVEDCLTVSCLEGENAIALDFFAGSGTTGDAVMNLNLNDKGNRKYILVEMGECFDAILKPRMVKVMHSREWESGRPRSKEGWSHSLKYIYLEQYEDTLANIVFRSKTKTIQKMLQTYDDYFLSYMLDYETRDSPARLTVDAFENPFDYKVRTVSGGEEKVESVDLVETFNYLLGLHVERVLAAKDGERYYRAVRGKKLDERRVLVVWRGTEGIDLMQDKEFIEKTFLKDETVDIIYVNGMCHVKGALPIEPNFKKLMGG